MANNPLLEVKQLSCERNGRVLFESVDFSVAAGEILQLEGPNGSGKTSMLRIISGLSSHYQGEILWRGERVNSGLFNNATTLFRAQMLYLAHQTGVKAALTPRQNLRWAVGLAGIRCSERNIEEALDRVGLYGYEDTPSDNLSAGQQRRIALARLSLSPATLWILDEPFTAIDRQGVVELENLLVSHLYRGGCIILTTHQILGISIPLKRLSLQSGQRQ